MNEKETILRVNTNKRSKVKIRGWSKIQIDLAKQGRLSAAVFAGILGGLAYPRIVHGISDLATEDIDTLNDPIVEDAVIEDEFEELFDYEVPTSVEFADNVDDDMTFGEAFQAARAQLGEGGFFLWKGNPYNTYTKEEWDSFTDEDKQDFFEMFQKNTDFEDGKIEDHHPDTTTDSDVHDDNLEDIEDVDLIEIGTDEEIIDGLNDGVAYDEEENIGEDVDV